MKLIVQFIALAVLLFSGACQRKSQPIASSASSARQMADASRLQASWKLETFRGRPVKEKQFGPRWPTLTFSVADSSVAGTGGCNRMRGKITIDAGRKIAFGPAAMTKMACTGQSEMTEDDFLKALRGIDSYSFPDDRLALSRGGKTEMTFTREK